MRADSEEFRKAMVGENDAAAKYMYDSPILFDAGWYQHHGPWAMEGVNRSDGTWWQHLQWALFMGEPDAKA